MARERLRVEARHDEDTPGQIIWETWVYQIGPGWVPDPGGEQTATAENFESDVASYLDSTYPDNQQPMQP